MARPTGIHEEDLNQTYTWTPILEGESREHVRHVVDEIADALAGELDHLEDSGATGDAQVWELADRALFFEYLGACRDNRAHHDAAERCLRLAVERMAIAAALPATVFAGWIALAWTLEHLQRVFPLDDAALIDSVEVMGRWSSDALSIDEWTGPYDYFTGLVGFGAHALERGARGEDDVRRVIAHLAALAEFDEAGEFVAWWSSPEHCGGSDSWPEGQYNLGLAHGTPGVVAFLSAALAAGIESDHGRTLLQKSIAWLLDLSREFGTSGFPAVIAPDKPYVPSDASWAYGDAGVAAAILAGARALGDSACANAALDIARRSLRRPVEDYLGPPRPNISHGAAGLTHIFGRLYHATSDPVFLHAARCWCRRILDHRQTSASGVAGFPEIHSQLFGGIVGIGLVLLAASEELEPRWDRLLLISI